MKFLKNLAKIVKGKLENPYENSKTNIQPCQIPLPIGGYLMTATKRENQGIFVQDDKVYNKETAEKIRILADIANKQSPEEMPVLVNFVPFCNWSVWLTKENLANREKEDKEQGVQSY